MFTGLDKKEPVCEIKGKFGENNKYQIIVENTDKCGNKVEGKSAIIVIDRTTPKISVTYVDGTPINGEYFNDKNSKTIKISVKEENFKSTAADIKVSAVDYAGGPVDIGELDCEWSDENGEHITKITLSKDAKYTIEVKNTDKAGNSGNAGPVTFTIDNTDPQGLYVTYNGNENISSPYYSNSPVSVTLHAKDDVSGIDHFKYKTVKTVGSSGINGGYVEKTVNFKDKDIKNSNGEFTYTFTLEPQFDGQVEFTAVDNAGNDASFGDTKSIVVDNKAPTSNITFNTPVQNVGGTSYYDGNITGTKTTVAMGMAACLSQNHKKVLYINASRLQMFQAYLGNQMPISAQDVYSRLLNPSDNIYGDIKHVIRYEDFYYLPAFKMALISLGIPFAVFEKIAVSAKRSQE